MSMRQFGRILALAGSLWFTDAALAPEVISENVACSMQRSGYRGRTCRTDGVASSSRAPADVYVRQRASPSRGLLYQRHVASDTYMLQTMRPSATPSYARGLSPWRSRGHALRLAQIPRPYRFAVPQPWPVYISRPCHTRFADPLACPQLRWRPDPFVDALLEAPNRRSEPILRALGLPIIPGVPPIIMINDD